STMTLVALALGAVTLLGRDSVGLVYLLTALTSAAGAFDNPSRQSLIPRLVPENDLPGALSIMLSTFQLASIGGPALTGLVLAGAAGAGPGPPSHAHAGLALIYFLNAASFLAVLLTLVTKPRAFLRARLGQEHRPGVEILREEAELPRDGRAGRLPLQAAGDHQVKDDE